MPNQRISLAWRSFYTYRIPVMVQIFSFLILSYFFLPSQGRATCTLPSPSQVILQDSTQVHETWTIPMDKRLWVQSKLNSAHLQKYEAWVRRSVNPDPKLLIVHARNLWAGAGDKYLVARFNMALENKAGQLTGPTCLEQFFLDRHFSRFNSNDYYPSEYLVYVLTKTVDGTRFLRIYFSHGEGRRWKMSPPMSMDVIQRITSDLRNGWAFTAHIHSHPFFMAISKVEFGGTPVPSDGDIGSYNQWNEIHRLPNAWITNGFATLRMKPAHYNLLKQTLHPPQLFSNDCMMTLGTHHSEPTRCRR
jgi:hypothetical protein